MSPLRRGSPAKLAELAQLTKLQVDRLEALRLAIGTVRRGGTLSLSGVYVALANLFPLGDLFDKQVQVCMGQANVAALDRRDPAAADRRRRLARRRRLHDRRPVDDAPQEARWRPTAPARC